eukprot:13142313-Alexandrium_andersonii.AAC.1
MRSQLTIWAVSCQRRITSSGTRCLAASAVTSLSRSAWVALVPGRSPPRVLGAVERDGVRKEEAEVARLLVSGASAVGRAGSSATTGPLRSTSSSGGA